MIGRVLSTILVLGIFLAFWQMSGGNSEQFFDQLWGIFYTAVSFVAEMITVAWNTIFTSI